jgi:hypothetical protein
MNLGHQFLLESLMKRLKSLVCAAALAMAVIAGPARAQSEASLLLSALPVASVVVGGSVGAAAVSVVPLALSVAGATLVVKAVEVTARGTVYLLERASDGAQASVGVVGSAASGLVAGAVIGVGSVVAVSVIGTGVLISTVAEVLAFIPNELGRALLYNQRLTN